MPTILAFGYHDRNSPRHRTVCAEWTRGGCTIVECHTDERGFLAKCRDLRRKFRALAVGMDTVLVPFPGHFLMPLAWWLTRRPRKRLIFDAFLSLYDTDVSDRRRSSPFHPWAWILWMIDWLSLHLADEILMDTEAHKRFLVEKFHVKPERVKVIYLEARKDLFHPDTTNDKRSTTNLCEVFFYGTLIPLQGVDTILAAARLLEERRAPVHVTLVGSEKFKRMVEDAGVKNVSFRGFVPMEELPSMIRSADLCLGIFGTSGKAQRVIPHKVVDAVACGVPVLTADTPAMRERFLDHPLVYRIPAGDPHTLANAIITRMQG